MDAINVGTATNKGQGFPEQTVSNGSKSVKLAWPAPAPRPSVTLEVLAPNLGSLLFEGVDDLGRKLLVFVGEDDALKVEFSPFMP